MTACSLTRKVKHPSMELGGDIPVADTPGKEGDEEDALNR